MENINNLIELNLKLCYADLKSIEAAKIDILKAVANEIEQVKKLNIDDVSGSDLIAKAEQYLEEAKYKIENFNEYDDDFGRGSYFGVKRIVNLIKRHYR